MEGIFAQIVTKELGILAAGIIAVMFFVGSIPIKGGIAKLRDHKIWSNWAFFLAVVLGVAGAFMPGVCDMPIEQWGSILIFGCLAAGCAMAGRKVLFPIFMAKLEGKKR